LKLKGRDRTRSSLLAPTFTAAAVCAALCFVPAGCGKIPESTVQDVSYTLSFEPSSAQIKPGGTLQVKVRATDESGQSAPDGTSVRLTPDSSLGNITPAQLTTTAGAATTTFTAGTQTGTTTITATSGKATASIAIKIDKNAKPPVVVPVDADDIDPATVTWLHPNPSAFKVTATLSNIRISGNNISWSWSHPTSWPAYGVDGGGVIGNHWVFAKIGGRWYAATWEWLRSTTSSVTLEAKSGEPPFIQSEASPISGWYPQSGEEIGFMVSTCVRGGIPAGSPKERSLIVKTTWP
jgi:hypothetical protein